MRSMKLCKTEDMGEGAKRLPAAGHGPGWARSAVVPRVKSSDVSS